LTATRELKQAALASAAVGVEQAVVAGTTLDIEAGVEFGAIGSTAQRN
jgi:hypothetical protein